VEVVVVSKDVKAITIYLRAEEKEAFKRLVASYQLSMQEVIRECVINMIREDNEKYHELMIDLFESPYKKPAELKLLDDEIQSIYAQLEEDTED
jgi:Cu2+-containing amine oxidase